MNEPERNYFFFHSIIASNSCSNMLTRVVVRRQPAFMARLLSDKVADSDGKNVASETTEQDKKPKKVSGVSASTEKIQDLLRSMVEANRAREETYKAKISTAPGIFKHKKPNIIEVKEEKIEEKVTMAVSEVAAALGGDTKKTEAELLSRVLGDVTQAPTNLSDLVLGMKVDRSKEPEEGFKMESRGQQVRRMVQRATSGANLPPRRDQLRTREPGTVQKATYVDVFSEAPLGILKRLEAPNSGPRMDTWQKLKRRELTLATTQPPSNYFEKMVQWTDQGKVWKFPINNEQGLEEETTVHFTEHVFIDNYLEGWCPQRGPIRHFMELVCVGLSKNPFYTAKEKKDHIMWFKEYFESKKDILTEVEALENTSSPEHKKTV